MYCLQDEHGTSRTARLIEKEILTPCDDGGNIFPVNEAGVDVPFMAIKSYIRLYY